MGKTILFMQVARIFRQRNHNSNVDRNELFLRRGSMKRFLCKAFTAAIVPLILLAGPAAADEPLRATSITAASTPEDG